MRKQHISSFSVLIGLECSRSSFSNSGRFWNITPLYLGQDGGTAVTCSLLGRCDKPLILFESDFYTCGKKMFEISAKSSKMSGPKARICYICGRQYMLHSFEIHVAQCRDLFEKREMTKPPKERRKCPTDPTIGMKGTMNPNDLDAVNAASQQAWTGSLAKCKFCGRSFLQEKLHIHNKSCTADNPARRVDEPVRRGNEKPITSTQQSYDISAYESQDGFEYAAGSGGGYGGYRCNDCGRSFNEIAYEKLVFLLKY